ncbi:uncharacterized protein PHACADRAFT_183341 [Phanerochaete carnosa HHB-10118-sp]|uniref:Uncharacterized protein n=1 Tax=Phanerochaete carnosa (strain HHB-10118-sp) TaxID=650164 RepID=K5WCL6_PHACS|nr:uncharacterized protein PHACADRAFT_183341 [Phanerochaete carnosa HHB-10118-sp]EKM56749.1 hypothetical protein PHACADRAFT_183341 [Phanerochaete carnosa HHB-10118-sp]
MKLPNFGRFFHKRSRSDSVLYRRAQPEVQLPPRPVSVSFSNGTILSLDTERSMLSELLSGVPITPLAVAIPRPVSTSTVSSGSQISAASQPVVIDTLARRIQELEDTIRTQEQNQTSVSSLDSSLESAQNTIHDAGKRNLELVDEVTQLRSELELARIDLDTLRSDHTRYKALLDIPVLSAVLAHLTAGDDPEEALVDAIKQAINEPGSTWRTLLEPVTGPRSPEDYIAQVNCTLRARREGRDWQKRAAFWRHSAKENGRHKDTVTPSASQLSDIIVDAQGAQRRSRAPTSQKLGDSGTVLSLVQVQVEVVSQVEVEKAVPESVEVVPAPLRLIRESSGSSSPGLNRPAADDGNVERKSTLQASETMQTVKENRNAERAVSQPYANLPPLASVIFRESHSIRSISPKKESVLVPSSSTLSQGSRKSVKSFRASADAGPSTPRQNPVENDAHIPGDCSFESLSAGVSIAECAPAPPSALWPVTEANTSGATADSDFSSTSWDMISNFINKSLSFSSLARIPGSSPEANSKSTESKAGPAEAQEQKAPAQLAHSPIREPKPSRIPSPTSSANSTPTSSPAKKSRLPLPIAMPRVVKIAMPQTARLMRRFSRQMISKPVLIDSTNAAAVGDSSPDAKARFDARGDRGARSVERGDRGAKSVDRNGRGAPRKMNDAPMPAGMARGLGKENLPAQARGRRSTLVVSGGSSARTARVRA